MEYGDGSSKGGDCGGVSFVEKEGILRKGDGVWVWGNWVWDGNVIDGWGSIVGEGRCG